MSKGAYGRDAIRRSLVHFLFGRVFTGAIGLFNIMLLVRLLSPQEYGAYIVLTGLFEVMHICSNFGIIPAAYRYVPELRVKGKARGLLILSRQLLTARILTLVLAAAALYLASARIAAWVDMPVLRQVLPLYAIVVIFEGLARYTDFLFDSLLLQGFSQISVLTRNGLRFVGLLLFKFGLVHGVRFELLLWTTIEAISCGIGSMISVLMFLSNVRLRAGESPAGDDSGLDYPRMLRYSLPAYMSDVAQLGRGQEVVKLLVARISDAIQTGAFGFAAALTMMVQRYLPAFLLIGMVRPLFVSAREKGRSNQEIAGYAVLIFKLNLFVVAPALALMVVLRDPVAIWLSGGRFPEAGPYLILMFIVLLVRVACQAMMLLLLVTEQSRSSLMGSMTGMLGVVGGVLATHWFGVIALCGGLIAAEALNATVAQLALRRHGMYFRYDVVAAVKMLAAAAVGSLAAWLIWGHAHHIGSRQIVMSVLLTTSIYLVICFLIKPFRVHERDLINKALPKPLFHW